MTVVKKEGGGSRKVLESVESAGAHTLLLASCVVGRVHNVLSLELASFFYFIFQSSQLKRRHAPTA